jgi:two-component system invasion response regulator UvrY
MTKILIADDHPIVREGLKHIIEEEADLSVAGETGSAADFFESVRNHDYDLVLLDITMPGMSGLDILKQVKIEKPGLPVLILSIHSEDQYAVRALKAGASGYLTKASAPDKLIEAIRKVLSGGRYVSPYLAERLAFQLDSGTEKQPHERLSDREFQVLCLIASGKTVKEIGDELALSAKTVSTYRSRILEKMHMKNNAELTHYAIKNNLLD